jgi:hypothetical protein
MAKPHDLQGRDAPEARTEQLDHDLQLDMQTHEPYNR